MNYTDIDLNIEQSRNQDATIIEQLRQRQQQQTFTFSNFNNMNTDVRFDYMGPYVEGTVEEQDAR